MTLSYCTKNNKIIRPEDIKVKGICPYCGADLKEHEEEVNRNANIKRYLMSVFRLGVSDETEVFDKIIEDEQKS